MLSTQQRGLRPIVYFILVFLLFLVFLSFFNWEERLVGDGQEYGKFEEETGNTLAATSVIEERLKKRYEQ